MRTAGRRRDKCWENVQDMGNGRFRCNFCNGEFSGGSTRINAHLSGELGKGIRICPNVHERCQSEVDDSTLVSKKSKTVWNQVDGGTVSSSVSSSPRNQLPTEAEVSMAPFEKTVTKIIVAAPSPHYSLQSENLLLETPRSVIGKASMEQTPTKTLTAAPSPQSSLQSQNHFLETTEAEMSKASMEQIQSKTMVAAPSPQTFLNLRPPLSLYQSMEIDEDEIEKASVDKMLTKIILAGPSPHSSLQSQLFNDFVTAVAKFGPSYQLPSRETLYDRLIPDLRKDVEKYKADARQASVGTGLTVIPDIRWERDLGGYDYRGLVFYMPKGAVYRHADQRQVCGAELLQLLLLLQFDKEVLSFGPPALVLQFITEQLEVCDFMKKSLSSKYPRVVVTSCTASAIAEYLTSICELDSAKRTLDDACTIEEFNLRIPAEEQGLGTNQYGTCSKFPHFLRGTKATTQGISDQFLRISKQCCILKSLIEHKEAIELALVSDAASSRKPKEMIATYVDHVSGCNEFWRRARDLLRVLHPIYQALSISCSDNPSLVYLYPAFQRASIAIDQWCDRNQSSEDGRVMRLLFKCARRNLIHPIHEAAALLNPSYMISMNFRADELMKEGINFLMENPISSNEKNEIKSEFDRYISRDPNLFTSSAMQSLTSFHPRIWWDVFGGTLPVLQKYAVRILSQPCNALCRYSTDPWFDSFNAEISADVEKSAFVKEMIMAEKFQRLEGQREAIDIEKLSGFEWLDQDCFEQISLFDVFTMPTSCSHCSFRV